MPVATHTPELNLAQIVTAGMRWIQRTVQELWRLLLRAIMHAVETLSRCAVALEQWLCTISYRSLLVNGLHRAGSILPDSYNLKVLLGSHRVYDMRSTVTFYWEPLSLFSALFVLQRILIIFCCKRTVGAIQISSQAQYIVRDARVFKIHIKCFSELPTSVFKHIYTRLWPWYHFVRRRWSRKINLDKRLSIRHAREGFHNATKCRIIVESRAVIFVT